MSEPAPPDRDPWRTVVCGVAERDGSLLIVRQQGSDDDQAVWTLPGGVVEAGESLEQGLRRELLEETGLRIERITRLLWLVESSQSLTFVFEVESSDHSRPRQADPDDLVKEAVWVPRHEAIDLLGALPRPFRRMREPTQAVLSGRAAAGSVWTYSIDRSEDRLVSVVPDPADDSGLGGEAARPGERVGLFEALRTTRAMRGMKSVPIPVADQGRILDTAVRAPSGVNNQPWHFVLVDDPALISAIGEIQRQAGHSVFGDLAAERPVDVDHSDLARVARSGSALLREFDQVPLVLLAFCRGDRRGGSIYPAVWSAMLAARGLGIGSVLTYSTDEGAARIAQLVGVPSDQEWDLAACVPMGYPTGRWGVPRRRSVNDVAGRNCWDGELGFEHLEGSAGLSH